MQILLDFLRRYNYLFLFILLEGISLTLLFQFNNYQGSVWNTAANESAAKTNETYAALEAYFKLGDINAILTTENTKLQQENAVLRAALDSATHDTTFTERKVRQELAGFQLLPARVVSNGVRRGHDGYLVINRGRKDGIRPEMGVVGGGVS